VVESIEFRHVVHEYKSCVCTRLLHVYVCECLTGVGRLVAEQASEPRAQ
jgi:hypothetical protein